ncbi:RNA polymerase sigma factor [Microbacterium sp. NPDC008134]|uniref:RNA polymerase sigma factor n=1 Tax=Microbacterium sp. NPDC008134 TaxID=3364183 RepID=UPI0036E16B15
MTDAFPPDASDADPARDDDSVDAPSPDSETTAELVRLAATGDRDAAGEYFALMMPSLTLTAKRVAGITHDADDLLGDALLMVLSKWSQGTGPTENVPAYIAQTMRNRIRDDFRSPRSKVAPLDNVEEPASTADPRIRELEIESEMAIVRRALAELPSDQQRVLVATVLEGRKPRDLEEHMARPAAAIYSLTRRAKGNLRRTTLRLLLEENARPECVAAAQLLPETVGDTPEGTKGGRSAEHYRTCPYCRRSWKRFAGLATLGALPLAGAVALAGPAGTAEASELPAEGADASVPEAHAPVDGPADTPVDAGSGPASWHEWARTTAMLAAAATALVLMTVVVVTFVTKTWFFAETPLGSLAMTSEAVDAEHSDFDMTITVQDESFTLGTLRMDLSVDVESITAPSGWNCLIEGGDVSCTTDRESPSGGRFEVAHAPATEVVFDIRFDGRTEGGAMLNGTARGTVGD